MDAERKAVMELYVGNFSARQDAYVKNSRQHVNEPLTPDLADQALREGFSLSGYMATKTDGIFVTHIGAIDFDMDDGMSQARRVRTFLVEHDIESLLVGSRRGAHLWVQADTLRLIPASIMRRALTNALTLLDIDPKKAEVFPKKSGSDWGAGALRLPLMRHPKSGVTYPAYDGFDDSEVTDPKRLVIVMSETLTPVAALRGLAGPETSQPTYPRRLGHLSQPRAATGDDTPRVTDLLADIGVQAIAGRSIRCPFHDDKKASLQIAPDDERAWCKAPACDINNDDVGLGSWELEKYIRKDARGATSS